MDPDAQPAWARALTTLDVRLDRRGVATVTLDRQDVRNAFDATLIAEMTATATRLGEDGTVRVVVLSGAGAAFSAGGDLHWMKGMVDHTPAENHDDAVKMDAMFRALWDLPKPVIGRVNGHAIAGGTGLAAVCDIVIAVEGALFGLTEVALGLAPAVIAPYVVRKIGISHARALFVTGELFDTGRAHHIGLVHHVVPDLHALDDAVDASIRKALKAGPHAVGVAKSMPERVSVPLDEATTLTPAVIAGLRSGTEGQEGMAAFFEKRPAAWVPLNPGGARD